MQPQESLCWCHTFLNITFFVSFKGGELCILFDTVEMIQQYIKEYYRFGQWTSCTIVQMHIERRTNKNTYPDIGMVRSYLAYLSIVKVEAHTHSNPHFWYKEVTPSSLFTNALHSLTQLIKNILQTVSNTQTLTHTHETRY